MRSRHSRTYRVGLVGLLVVVCFAVGVRYWGPLAGCATIWNDRYQKYEVTGASLAAGAEWMTPSAVHSVCGEDASYLAANFIDGSTGTEWHHTVNHVHWIILDLGTTYSVLRVQVWTPYVTAGRWWVDIYVSEDAVDWGVAVGTSLRVYPGGGWQVLDVTDKAGRYVKLVVTSTDSASKTLHGSEFQAEVEEVPPAVQPYSFIM